MIRRDASFVASLAGFGRRARRSACHCAVEARYSSRPLRVAALRRSSREIVDGERPIRRATSRTPIPRARRSAISSRSPNDKYRPDVGRRLSDGIPPPSRNHRTPTAADTPTAAAASSLETPRAISTQKRCRCSRRPAGGRPGDRIAGRPARSDARLLALIATPLAQALRRSVESAQFTSWAFTTRARESGLLASMGSVGDALDNAVVEAFWARMQVELFNRKKWRTRVELANAMFEYLEIFHNRQRRHSALGMHTPIEYEILHQTRQCVA